MKITFSPPTGGNITDRFKVGNNIKNKNFTTKYKLYMA